MLGPYRPESETEENDESYTKGPYIGHDISVYHLNVDKLSLEALASVTRLPRLQFSNSDPAFFAGWKDQEPIHKLDPDVKVKSITHNDYFPQKG